MVGLMKPCVKCGVVDRNKSRHCRPCRKKWQQTYRESAEGRAKIKSDGLKYSESAEGRAKIKAYKLKYRESAEGRAKIKAYKLKYRESDKFRELSIAAQEKFIKRQFEFSLQTQQKVIEQCQAKST